MMKITITLQCPRCSGSNIVKNGKKPYQGKQNYICKSCKRQFIGDYQLSYLGCLSFLVKKIQKMLVRGLGIRDIAAIEGISLRKVLSVLTKQALKLVPKKSIIHV
jgi:insertion element IS1 protein InsB